MKFASSPDGWLAGTCLLLLLSLGIGPLSSATNQDGTTGGEEEEEESCEDMKPYANFGFDLTGTGINLVDGQNPPQPKRRPGQPGRAPPGPVHPDSLPPHVITQPTGSETCNVDSHGYMCEFVKSCGNLAPRRQGYILNGQRAEEAEFPSFVQLKLPDGTSCGGVIVSDWHVVTAAHCVVKFDFEHPRFKPPVLHYSLFTVYVGSIERWPRPDPRRQEYPVAKICVSRVFQMRSNVSQVRGDIAMIRLGRKIVFNERVQPACWPYKFRAQPQLTGDHSNCYATGMGDAGKAPSDQLMKWRIQVDVCNRDPLDPNQTHLCVRQHKDHGPRLAVVCHGDSGGPVFCADPSGRFILSGIISWGPSTCVHSPDVGITRLDDILEYAQLSSGECALNNPDKPLDRPRCDQTHEGPMCAESSTCGTTRGVPYMNSANVARPYEYPFFVSVRANGDAKRCSGALIGSLHVATSKTCLTLADGTLARAKDVSVFVGSKSGDDFDENQRKQVQVASYCYSKRRMITLNGREGDPHKLVILMLEIPLMFYQDIQPACWPYKFRDAKSLIANGDCVLLGRSRTDSRNPNGELLRIPVTEMRCFNQASGYNCFNSLTPYVTTCGDIGSPIACRDTYSQWVLVAVVENTTICLSHKQIIASPIDGELDKVLALCKDTATT